MPHPYDFSDLEYELEHESDLDESLEDRSSESSVLPAENIDELAGRFSELSPEMDGTAKDLDNRVGELLGEVERDYFFGKLMKKLKKKGLKGLLKKAVQLSTGVMPVMSALQGATKIARGVLRNKYLGPLAKAAISSVPGGAVAMPALQALGFEHEAADGDNGQFWSNYAELAREAYDDLADRMETAETFHESSDLAEQAFQEVLGRRGATSSKYGQASTRVIRVIPGQSILIKVG